MNAKNEVRVRVRAALGSLATGVVVAVLGAVAATAPASAADATFDIVAVGDSFASGEGAPALPGAYRTTDGQPADPARPRLVRWGPPTQDHGVPNDAERCHRSPLAGTEVAARELGRLYREIRVTHVSFACSGATIDGPAPDGGLLSPYRGAAAGDAAAPLDPQLTQVERSMHAQAGRDVDALIVAAGVNDIGFGALLTRVATGCDTPAPDGTCPAGPTGASTLTARLAALAGAYDRLGQAIRGQLPVVAGEPSAGLTRRPRRVYVQQYPDPVHDAGGNLCDGVGDDPLVRRLRAADSLAIAAFVLPELNRQIQAAAGRNGWVPVPMGAAFLRHGICAGGPARWFNDNLDAVSSQGADAAPIPGLDQPVSRGAAHPNAAGHREIARRTLTALLPQIDADPRVRAAGRAAIARARSRARDPRAAGAVPVVAVAGRRVLTASAGEPVELALRWTHPASWRDLRVIHVRIRTRAGVVATIALDPVRRRARIAGAAGRLGRATALGAAGRLSTPHVSVVPDESLLADSGPRGRSVVALLALRPTARLRGLPVTIETRVTRIPGGDRPFTPVARLRVIAG